MGLFKPAVGSSVQRNKRAGAATPTCSPTPTRTDVVTTNVNLNQRLPWFRHVVLVGWDTSRTSGDSFLNSYNPLLRSGTRVLVFRNRSSGSVHRCRTGVASAAARIARLPIRGCVRRSADHSRSESRVLEPEGLCESQRPDARQAALQARAGTRTREQGKRSMSASRRPSTCCLRKPVASARNR